MSSNNNPSFTNGITNSSTPPLKPSTPLSSTTATTVTTPFPPGPYDPSLPLYCFCRRPDLGKWMIACDGCDDWFHGECISIPESDGNLIEFYFCAKCTSLGKRVTEWKRMCRLPDCRRPADVAKQSKYCCQEHGVEFMKLKIASERNKLAKPVLAALAAGAESIQEFKTLGKRIPTPPIDEMAELNLDGVSSEDESQRRKMLALANPYPEIYKRLSLRKAFIEFCWGRRARVIEGLKEKDVGGGSARWEICGYDEKLGLGDEEFLEWIRSTEEGSMGIDNLCMKKKCTKHAGWGRIKLEEVQLEERLSGDKIRGLKEEEGREWEGLKKRVWRDRERMKAGRAGRSGNGNGVGMAEEEGGWVIDERVGAGEMGSWKG
ncbi:hypothetical protein EV426DRAFT_528189 [Tirmania nivea]|nr:hypothetical protein EV426DRAFT_528189 [Tirmania nivea]